MCTGAELALMAAGTAGTAIQQHQSRRQQDAIVDAQNDRLEQFLDRNKQRSDEAMGVYRERQEAIEPENVQRQQAEAEAKRGADLGGAVERATPAAAAPIRGSAESIIGDVFRDRSEDAAAKSGAQADALARTSSFGDMLFNQGLGINDAGRRIQGIVSDANADSQMLPHYQDLAGGAAAAKNRPGMIGPLLSGAAGAGGAYLGSRRGGG